MSVLQSCYHLDKVNEVEDEKSVTDHGLPKLKPFTARTSDKFGMDHDRIDDAKPKAFLGANTDRGKTQIVQNEFKTLNPNASLDHLYSSVNTSNKSISNDVEPLRSERELFQQNSIDYKAMKVVSFKDYTRVAPPVDPTEKQTMFNYRKKNSFGRMSFGNSNSEAQLGQNSISDFQPSVSSAQTKSLVRNKLYEIANRKDITTAEIREKLCAMDLKSKASQFFVREDYVPGTDDSVRFQQAAIKMHHASKSPTIADRHPNLLKELNDANAPIPAYQRFQKTEKSLLRDDLKQIKARTFKRIYQNQLEEPKSLYQKVQKDEDVSATQFYEMRYFLGSDQITQVYQSLKPQTTFSYHQAKK